MKSVFRIPGVMLTLAIASSAVYAQVGPLSPVALPMRAAEGATPVTDLPVKRVTLKVDNMPLRDALAQLQQQTQLQIEVPPIAGQKPVSADIQNKTAWEALRILLDKASPDQPIAFSVADAAGSLQSPQYRQYTPAQVGGPFCTSGPFLLFASQLTRAANFDQEADHASLRLNLSIITDGSVRIGYIIMHNAPQDARDDKGNVLLPKKRLPSEEMGFSNNPFYYGVSSALCMDLPAPGQRGSKLSVAGAIPATILVSERIEIPYGKTAERKINGITVKMSFDAKVPPGAPAPEVHFGSNNTPGGESPLHLATQLTRESTVTSRQWQEFQRVSSGFPMNIVDSSGKSWYSQGTTTAAQNSDSMWTLTRFQSILRPSGNPIVRLLGSGGTPAPRSLEQIGKDVKVVVDLPTAIHQFNIPYQFENIRLP